jgi:DmsE family decaheme c-type cytochrome
MCDALRLLLTIGVLLGGVALVAASEDYAGSEACAVCHEEVAVAFERSPHALAPGWEAATGCEDCHGSGAAHVEAGGDTAEIVRFGELTPAEASDRCLACHERQEKHFRSKRSIHRLGEVGCIDCHDPHGEGTTLLRAQGRELCATCHQAVASSFDLPRSHPVDTCADCHEPHATEALRGTRTLFDRTCGNCHFEKTGPFLYGHDTLLVDGCAACHEVHGSPNRHLLKHEGQVNLCYQCHSASVTPGWHSAPRFLNEKCTACHTAIHGSNTNPFFLEE